MPFFLSHTLGRGVAAGAAFVLSVVVAGCATAVDIEDEVIVAPGSGGIQAIEGFLESLDGDGEPGVEPPGDGDESSDAASEIVDAPMASETSEARPIDDLPRADPVDESPVDEIDEVDDGQPDDPEATDADPAGDDGAADDASAVDPEPEEDPASATDPPPEPGPRTQPEPTPNADPATDLPADDDPVPPLFPDPDVPAAPVGDANGDSLPTLDPDEVLGASSGDSAAPAEGHCLGGWEGGSCDICSGETQSDRSACRAYIECYITNDCAPGTCGNLDDACGVNQLGNGLAPKSIADSVYDCMCTP